jgi:hypothetical protein
MEAIDECILAACIHSLELATTIILQVHGILENSAHSSVRSHASATHGEVASGSGAGSGSGRGNSGTSHGNSGKRSNGNGQASDRPAKQQRVVAENRVGGTGLLSGSLPTFACHFCKKDPTKYNFWADPSPKYKNCPHPSIPHNDLRRIK